MRTRVVAASVLALAALGACSSSSAKKDVTITSCKADPGGGHPTVAGSIHNHSSKASTYAVHVKLDDKSGNGVGDAAAAVARVDSGANAKWTATGSEDAKGPVTCSVASVTRTIAP
jgi:hypothetical protein